MEPALFGVEPLLERGGGVEAAVDFFLRGYASGQSTSGLPCPLTEPYFTVGTTGQAMFSRAIRGVSSAGKDG